MNDLNSKKIFHLIANTKSGRGAGALLPEIGKQCAEANGVELVYYPTTEGYEFENQIDAAVLAAQKTGGIVIAAGGDGTIRAVAEKAVKGAVKFAVIPCGTFNFFARAHRIPEDPVEAFKLAMTGGIANVRLGKLNNYYFLINASLGLYAKSIHEREENTKRFGRARVVVILSTIRSLLKLHRQMHVDIVRDGKTDSMRTMSIFVGNNALQLRNLALNVASCMKVNRLAAVVLKPVSRLDMLRIIWRGLSKTLDEEGSLDFFCVDSLTIRLPRKTMIALDGEIFYVDSPVKIAAIPNALQMVVPAEVKTS